MSVQIIGKPGASGWEHIRAELRTQPAAMGWPRRHSARPVAGSGLLRGISVGRRLARAGRFFLAGLVIVVAFLWITESQAPHGPAYGLFSAALQLGVLIVLPILVLLGWGPAWGQWGQWRLVGRGGHSSDPAPVDRVEAAITAARRRDMTGIPEHLRSYAWGALGEEETGRVLAQLGAGWSVAHDLTIVDPGTGRERANIDHVVVSPSGAVAMVDTKRWAGVLTTTPDGRYFDCDGDAQARQVRRGALETLLWEAEQLHRCEVIVVAVAGRGTVAGGGLELTMGRGRNQPRVIAVPAQALPQVLPGVLQGRGPGMARALSSRSLVLQK